MIIENVGAVISEADTLEVRFGDEYDVAEEEIYENEEYDLENEIGHYVLENGIESYPVEDFDEEAFNKMEELFADVGKQGEKTPSYEELYTDITYEVYPETDMRYSAVSLGENFSVNGKGDFESIDLKAENTYFTDLYSERKLFSEKNKKSSAANILMTASGIGMYEDFNLKNGEIKAEMTAIINLYSGFIL